MATWPVCPWYQWLDTLEFHQPVTFLVGENGSGKSTLLEAVAVALGLQPGRRHPQLLLFHGGHPFGRCHRCLDPGTRAHTGPKTAFSSGPRAFTTPPAKWTGWHAPLQIPYTKATAANPSTINPTGRAFSAWCTTGSGAKGCTCWTSRKSALSPTRQLAAAG